MIRQFVIDYAAPAVAAATLGVVGMDLAMYAGMGATYIRRTKW